MPRHLILIGPMHAGKSTIATLLAERVGVQRICMDHVRWDYYKEIGYREEDQKAAYERGGFAGMIAYWKPFEAHAVERLLADVKDEPCVIDFGAGHSVYDDPALFERVRAALAGHVAVLLLPSRDIDRSIEILRQRRDERYPEQAGRPTDVNDYFLRHPSNAQLADFTIYTDGRTPEETASDVAIAVGRVW